MDVTGQNIANANTDGYSRQRMDLQSVGGAPVPAMNSLPDASLGGVTVTGVDRVQDLFLESRGRIEHAQNSFLTNQNQMFTEVQQAFNEPSDTAGATAHLQSDGSMSVFLAGSSLVNGSTSRLVASSGAARLDDIGIAAPTALTWVDNGYAVNPQSGEVASMLQTMNTILPNYSTQLDSVAANLAGAVNAQHA